MGVLDDAIRQHLELKRAHGAAEDDVQRQEKEALGPARREQTQEPAVEAQSEPEPEAQQPEAPAPAEPEAPVEPEAESQAEPEAAPPAAPEPTGDTPTKGFDAIDEVFADEEPAAEEKEDVLEETPDFLQETPEHDRLWFEQKPPRDFDFDE